MFKAVCAVAGSALVGLCASTTSASPVIVANGEDASVTAIGSAQTLGNDGFYLLNVGNNATSYADAVYDPMTPAYVSSFALNSGDTPYHASTSLDVFTPSGSSSQVTGVVYQGGAAATLATFTLSSTASIPTEFQIGILADNLASNNNLSNFTVSDGSGTSTTTDADPTNGANDFYLVDITGASAGDTITIVGDAVSGNAPGYPPGNSSGGLIIGGVTFDTIVVTPEPASIGLLAIAGLGLLSRHRRGS